jgi:FkbM family methyltransferase
MSLISTLRFIIQHPTNKNHKLSALLRFTKWQIGSRLVPGQVIIQWIDGAKFIAQPGETGITQNIYCGLHEFQEMAYVLHVLTPDDLFIDVGANVGSYTILACAARGARGYCFEPIPTTYQKLMENIKINNISSRVKPYNIGISDEEGEILFTSDKNTVNHVITKGESITNAINVHVKTLDELLIGESPSVMKIDVEGFETKVINGAIHTLKNPSLHSMIIESNESNLRYGYDERKLIQTIKSMDFQAYSYDPINRELKLLIDNKSHNSCAVFIRNYDLVRSKLVKANRITVNGFEF